MATFLHGVHLDGASTCASLAASIPSSVVSKSASFSSSSSSSSSSLSSSSSCSSLWSSTPSKFIRASLAKECLLSHHHNGAGRCLSQQQLISHARVLITEARRGCHGREQLVDMTARDVPLLQRRCSHGGSPVFSALATGAPQSGKVPASDFSVRASSRTRGGPLGCGDDGSDGGGVLSLRDEKRLLQARAFVGFHQKGKGKGAVVCSSCPEVVVASVSGSGRHLPSSAGQLGSEFASCAGVYFRGMDKLGCRMVPGGSSSDACTGRWNRNRPRRRHKGGTGVYCAAAQRQQVVDGTVAVPIHFYQVLGAQTHFLSDAILRAYDGRISNPPTEGFSEEGLATRLEILRLARATLTDPAMREAYNQGLIEDEPGTLMVDIPWQKLPGTLCLLQEIGEVELVLELGAAARQRCLSEEGRCDIDLAMALAHVEISRELMNRVPPAVVEGCERLRAALDALRIEEGVTVAPQLQEEIEASITQIMPACVVELLSLPLDEQYAERRKEGFEGLKEILWGKGGGIADLPPVLPGGMKREQFLSETFGAMIAEEQVTLFMSTPQHIPADTWEVYNACLAHVADGYMHKKPQCIQDAAALLSQLEQSLSSSSSGGASGPEVDDRARRNTTWNLSLEKAMCSMLLGRIEDAKSILGIENPESPIEVSDVVAKKGAGMGGGGMDLDNRAIREFVYEHSAPPREEKKNDEITRSGNSDPTSDEESNLDSDEEEEDYDPLLPGLCLLLEKWLEDTVFPPFRDSIGQKVILDEYYNDEGVRSYLARLDKRAFGVSEVFAEAGKVLKSVHKTTVQTLNKVFATSRHKEGEKAEEMSGGQGEGGDHKREATVGQDLVGEKDANEWGDSLKGGGVRDNAVVVKDRQGNYQETGVGWLVKPLAVIVAGSLVYGGLVLMGVVRLPPRGEGPGWRRFSAWFGGGNAAAVAETCAPSRTASISEVTRPGRALEEDLAVAIVTSEGRDGEGAGSTQEKENEPATSQKMNPLLAERMVRKWQTVKARALGTAHHIEELKEVLEGSMLSLWSERANTMAKNGWHWEYKLLSLKIDNVKVRDGGKSATVEATLQEAAQVHDKKKPDLNDSYRSTYSARYEMRNVAERGWRISKGEVVVMK